MCVSRPAEPGLLEGLGPGVGQSRGGTAESRKRSKERIALGNGVRMEIQTSRFGRMTVDEERVMTFPRGLLGFPNHNRFALIQTGEENYFFWLQSIDDPSLAFVVTDPTVFFKDYQAPLRE